MKIDRWERLEALFEGAVELDSPGRAAFLDRECGDDPLLRKQVESLILSDQEAASFIGGVVGDAARLVDTSESVALEGKLFGSYRVVRQLGHGGMGAVYLAQRADDEYQKQVAIKLVKEDFVTRQMRRRFLSERQILANLDHPNIARLIDGGTTETNDPYVVMEYVEGEPIDKYCDRQRLTTADRVALFRKVCSAVQYAHQNLVVHRDIKPANVLVTTDGEPKLLDFGIAKLLQQDQPANAVAETRVGVRLMTPEYASPEQVRGEVITTASDVYSLGVLLYELLSGRRPFRLTSYTAQEIERAVCQSEPEKPSTAVTRGEITPTNAEPATAEETSALRRTTRDKLRRMLQGDLDNIVLMAMCKTPERRYASAEQLSEDLRRYLEGMPVIAQGERFGYRARKFIGRHTPAVVTAAAVIVLIAGLVGFYTGRLAAERDRARVEAAKATQVSEFLTGLFEVSDPSRSKGATVTARELLDQGAARIEKELIKEPAVQAAMMTAVGKVYQSIGLYDQGTPLLEKALEIRRSLYGDQNAEVARSMYNLGSILQAKGDNDSAETLYKKALEIQRPLLGDESTEIAETLNNIAEVRQYKGDLDDAAKLYREALSINRRLLGVQHREIATNLSNLATVMAAKGDLDSAISLNGEALEMRRKLLGADHPDLPFSLNNQAVFLQQKGDYDQAERLFRESLAIRIRILGEDHPDVGKNLSNLGFLLMDKENLTEAGPLLRRSLVVLRKTLPPDHSDLSRPLLGLGSLLVKTGDPKGAEQLLREAVEIRRGAMPKGHWRIAEAESVLGGCLAELKEYSAAETLLVESYENLKSNRGEKNKTTIRTLNQIVKLYEEWGRLDKAEQYRAAL